MPYTALNTALAQAAPAVTLGAPRVSVGKTLLTMRTELKHQLGLRSDITDTQVTQWINDAYIDVCSSITLPELEASFGIVLTVGQALYLLPEGVYSTRSVALVEPELFRELGGRLLGKIDRETYRTMPEAIGSPEAYFRLGRMIVLWPTPNAPRTISVDVRVEPRPLLNNTDSPFLSRSWHEIIVKAARAKAHSDLQEPELALAAEREWTAMVRRREDAVAEEDKGRLVGTSIPRRRADLYRYRG